MVLHAAKGPRIEAPTKALHRAYREVKHEFAEHRQPNRCSRYTECGTASVGGVAIATCAKIPNKWLHWMQSITNDYPFFKITTST